MTAFDEEHARRPFADLGRDIGDVNRYYARGEHPAERRAAAQHAEENAVIHANVRPAMRTNNRLRNYMHFMAPLVQDRDNLSDDDGDAVDDRYDELRSAGLANTLGGARANAMDAGVHDPQIRREDVGIYRSLRQGPRWPSPVGAEAQALGVQGRKSLNLWQEGDPEPPSSSAIEQGDYQWHRMSSGTEIRRVGPDEDSDDGESDGGNYRTQALAGGDRDEMAAWRARMGLAPIQQPAAPNPLAPRVAAGVDDDSDSDTESLQTESEYPYRGALDINAGLGAPQRAAVPTGPRPGAMNVSKYFSTFGARMQHAGFWGALGGRGGARAEKAAEQRANAQRRRNAQRWAQPSLGTQLFRKAPYPWMRSAEWNRDEGRKVGRGAGDDRVKREWKDDASLATNPALGMSRESVGIWESNLDQAHAISEQRRRGGGAAGASQGDLFRKVHGQVTAQGGSGAAAQERTRNLMMMMLKLSPHRASQDAGAGSSASYAKDGIIDGIPMAFGQPSTDFPDYIPPAVTQVFRNFDPNSEDGGPGYLEADMRHKFPDVIPGAKGLNARAMTSDSDRTLSDWDPNEAMDYPGPEEEQA